MNSTSNKSKVGFIIVTIIAIVAIIIAFRLNAKVASINTVSTQQVTADDQVKKILADVGQHIIVPANEVPTIAVVSDLSKLAGQPFFERAMLGDVVLIYPNYRRAILWRPSTMKIVEVSAINFPSTVGQTTPAGTTPAKK